METYKIDGSLQFLDKIVIIESQTEFNNIIERVAANQYKINDTIYALEFNNITNDYQVSGILSGGDSWGYIETNNCVTIKFNGGAFLDFENERGYLEINTDDCVLKNVNIQGTGTVASAITKSFLLNANRVIFNNCKCSSRLSNTTISGFEGSATAIHNENSKYEKHTNLIFLDLQSDDSGRNIRNKMIEEFPAIIDIAAKRMMK